MKRVKDRRVGCSSTSSGVNWSLCICASPTCVLLLYCAKLLSWLMSKGWKMSRWYSVGRAVNTNLSSPTSRTRERDDVCAQRKVQVFLPFLKSTQCQGVLGFFFITRNSYFNIVGSFPLQKLINLVPFPTKMTQEKAMQS